MHPIAVQKEINDKGAPKRVKEPRRKCLDGSDEIIEK